MSLSNTQRVREIRGDKRSFRKLFSADSSGVCSAVMLTLLKKITNNAISPLFLNPFSSLGYLERREGPGALVWPFSFD